MYTSRKNKRSIFKSKTTFALNSVQKSAYVRIQGRNHSPLDRNVHLEVAHTYINKQTKISKF